MSPSFALAVSRRPEVFRSIACAPTSTVHSATTTTTTTTIVGRVFVRD
jgi:hypothetical protein